MKNVIIITSRGQNQTIQTTATTWGELVVDLKANDINPSGMKAVVGKLNVTLESPEAVLPVESFVLFLTPVKIKAGSFDFEYSVEDIEKLTYLQLRTELKSIRRQANELEDEKMINVIGNYTHYTVPQLRNTLTFVYETSTVNIKDVVQSEDMNNLHGRLCVVEHKLGIVNVQNQEYIYNKETENMIKVMDGII